MKIFLVFVGYCGSVDTSKILSFHLYFSFLFCILSTFFNIKV